MAENSNSGWGTGTPGTGTGMGTGTGTGSTGTGTGFGAGTGGTGSMGGGTGSGSSGFGVTSATDRGTGSDTGTCPHCGQSLKGSSGLEQFLGRLGITEEMIGNLKSQFQNVEIDEYLNTARDYLKDSSGKATSYAKENPGKVAAGVAALALGAGLIYAATNRDK
ncbi:MAG: hypothetical protein ACJ74H_11065 [Thermoanaerobaculia bacterium]